MTDTTTPVLETRALVKEYPLGGFFARRTLRAARVQDMRRLEPARGEGLRRTTGEKAIPELPPRNRRRGSSRWRGAC